MDDVISVGTVKIFNHDPRQRRPAVHLSSTNLYHSFQNLHMTTTSIKRFGRCSLVTSNYESLSRGLSAWLKMKGKFNTQETRLVCSEKFRRCQKRDRLYESVGDRLLHEKNPVFIVAGGESQFAIKGTCTWPITTESITLNRRMPLANKAYTE